MSDEIISGLPPRPATVNRASIVLHLVQESNLDAPHGVYSSAQGLLELSEQPYTRRILVPETWIPLVPEKACWLAPDQVGLVVVENLAGTHLASIPTPEEQTEIDAKFIEIGNEHWSMIVRPKWPQFFRPSEAGSTKIRSMSGTTNIRLTLFPK